MSEWIILSHMIWVDNLTTMSLNRVPFYHVFKTTFLLYLALPQTHGASHVYSHEVEIDAALGRVKEQIWRWMMMRCPREAMTGDIRALPALLHAPSKPPSTPSSLSHLHPQSLRSTASNHRTQSPYPYAQPLSQPLPHDSRARGPTSAIDMHPGAVLLAQRRALEAELSALPHQDPHGEAYSAMPRAASSTYRLAPGDERGRCEEICREEIGSMDEGEGAGDDRGRAMASGGSWSS
ncbi:hypothetical protein JB92DRAFT_3054539 [Gautieria morchelliformis]|nr:hypothetical protein JB92DRAFT_3054539 [Gautieria morchelliformis]